MGLFISISTWVVVVLVIAGRIVWYEAGRDITCAGYFSFNIFVSCFHQL